MTKAIFCGLFLLMLPASGSSAVDGSPKIDDLYGTWRLVRYQRTVVATGEAIDEFGKAPKGFLSYGRDGRMLGLIVKDGRQKPPDLTKVTDQERAELERSMISYGGTFTVNGNTVTHHVDISWNETWTGTEQVRNFKIEGRTLTISTNPQPHPIDGRVSISHLVFEKVE